MLLWKLVRGCSLIHAFCVIGKSAFGLEWWAPNSRCCCLLRAPLWCAGLVPVVGSAKMLLWSVQTPLYIIFISLEQCHNKYQLCLGRISLQAWKELSGFWKLCYLIKYILYLFVSCVQWCVYICMLCVCQYFDLYFNLHGGREKRVFWATLLFKIGIWLLLLDVFPKKKNTLSQYFAICFSDYREQPWRTAISCSCMMLHPGVLHMVLPRVPRSSLRPSPWPCCSTWVLLAQERLPTLFSWITRCEEWTNILSVPCWAGTVTSKWLAVIKSPVALAFCIGQLYFVVAPAQDIK